jgi:hypothetical protein
VLALIVVGWPRWMVPAGDRYGAAAGLIKFGAGDRGSQAVGVNADVGDPVAVALAAGAGRRRLHRGRPAGVSSCPAKITKD